MKNHGIFPPLVTTPAVGATPPPGEKLPYPQPRVYGAVANSGADPKIGPGDNNEGRV